MGCSITLVKTNEIIPYKEKENINNDDDFCQSTLLRNNLDCLCVNVNGSLKFCLKCEKKYFTEENAFFPIQQKLKCNEKHIAIIVDDCPVTLSLHYRLVSRMWPQLVIETATNVTKTLQLLELTLFEHIFIMLLDMYMENGTGIDIVKVLSNHGFQKNKSIEFKLIIATTAKHDVEQQLNIHKNDLNIDFIKHIEIITKPIKYRDLQ